MTKFNNIVLALSGLALFYVSTMRLIDPSAATFLKTFLADPQNALTTEMASEIRGIGANMVLAGIVAFLGIFIPRFKVPAFVSLSALFAGVVLGRAVSSIVDGPPDEALFMPVTHEAILAAANVFCLVYILITERKSADGASTPTS